MGSVFGVSNVEKKRIINEIILNIPREKKMTWNTNDSALKETFNSIWKGNESSYIDPSIPHPNMVRIYILPKYANYFN